MDTKGKVAVIIGLLAVVLVWKSVSDWVFVKLGYNPNPPVPTAVSTTQPATEPIAPNSSAPSASAPTSAPASALRASASGQSQHAVIGSAQPNDSSYRLAIDIDPTGAGFDSVVLNEFKKSVDSAEPYVYQRPYEVFENASRPLATRQVEIDGNAVDLSQTTWRLESHNDASATFAADLLGPDNTPIATLLKSFQLFPKSDKSNGEGYEVEIRQTIKNLTGKPINASIVFNGPTTPPRESDRGSDRMMIGGYLDNSEAIINQNYIEAFGIKQPKQDYTKSDKGFPLLWAGAASVYFDALIRPVSPDASKSAAELVQKVEAVSLNPEAEDAKTHEVSMTFHTAPMTIAPAQSGEFLSRAFFGPKKRELLRDEYYSALPRGYNATLVITSGVCSVCTFGWLIDALVVLLKWFHFVLHDWGLSIIALVALVRFALHPITKKSQQNMANMSKFGPELDKIKKKYADQPDEMNKAMMGFYKEHGATPILGCLPMFLQMPIWIALWQALQTTFELRHAPFLRFGGVHLTWIKDLAQPDHLITFEHPFTLWILTVSGLNILPIFMGVTMIIQQKYFTPQPPTMTDEQKQQQKMMQWMSGLLFPLMLYSGPSGLNLYIFTSTTFGIIESKVIRKHIKEREDAAKEGRVIVDAGKKFGRGGGKSDDGEPKKQGRIGKWIADLQAKAEQMQRDAKRGK